MSYPTASALIDAVRTELDNTAASDAVMYRLLNHWVTRIQRLHDFTFTEYLATATIATSATDFSTVAQPSDTKELLDLYYLEGKTRNYVTPLSWRDFLQIYPSPTAQTTGQKPQHWAVFQESIYVMPISSAMVTHIHYLRYLPEMTAASTNRILTDGEDALYYGLCAGYATWIRLTDQAAAYGQLAGDALQAFLKTHQATKIRPMQSLTMRTPGTVTRYGNVRRRTFLDDRW